MDNITKRIAEMYGASKSDFTTGRIEESEQKEMLCGALKSIGSGRILLPNSLYDGMAKKYRRAVTKKSLARIESLADERGEVLYKYLIPIDNYTLEDNVWSKRTIGKSRTAEKNFFKEIGFPLNPRLPKLERAAQEKGGFHIQGIVSLPLSSYPSGNFERINGGVFEWGVYLAKVSEQSLERDKNNNLYYKNFPLVLSSVQVWYVQTLRNKNNGINRNPPTAWRVGIPNEKRGGSWA